MAKLLYNFFLKLLSAAFKIAALFNNKARLGVQGRKNSYKELRENPASSQQSLVWMHCASLGEFEQGRPLLESIKQKYPHISVALSFFSSSGYEVMKNYKGADQVFYLPMDNAPKAKKIVDALNPSLVLWVKYEFWYYYLHELKNRNIPVLLVSGIFRKSNTFFKWYGGIWKKMLGCFTHFFVQNEASKNLLATLGIHDCVTVSGDTRFDRVIEIVDKFEPLPLIEQFCGDSKIMVAGSTWEDDEAELTHYVKANPQIKFIIAPHEIGPENIKDVQNEFANTILYSELMKQQQEPVTANPTTQHVLIIDNVGMLSRLYHYAAIAFVGGGFGADGVHNVLEAAVYGKPVLYGPEYERYAEAVGLVACGGGVPVENALELEKVLNELWEDKNLLASKGTAARSYVYSNAGATSKIIEFIQEKRLLTN